MWSTIFIIDPFYSVPLLSGVLVVLILSNKSSWVHFANVAGLLLSTIYLICTVGIKIYVTDIVHQSFERQDISYQKMLITPTPFNTLLWRVLAIDDTGYFEGFYSLFDNTKDVQVRHYYSDKSLLKGMANQWPVKRLQWFTHGFYSVKKDGNDIVIVDLRMGIEPFYVFQFKIGSVGNPHVKTINTTWIKSETHWYQLRWVWQRIWTVKPGISYRQDS
jgi:inner membrane protein